MKCPVDQADLLMTDRQGIEIDYCSQCRGVWLDRGELDKIIERSATIANTPSSRPDPIRPAYREPERHDTLSHSSNSYGYPGGHKKKKKENFLGDLFDF